MFAIRLSFLVAVIGWFSTQSPATLAGNLSALIDVSERAVLAIQSNGPALEVAFTPVLFRLFNLFV